MEKNYKDIEFLSDKTILRGRFYIGKSSKLQPEFPIKFFIVNKNFFQKREMGYTMGQDNIFE